MMMMAHDSTPERPALDRATLDTLRAAIRGYLANQGSPEALESSLRSVATEARERRLQAEQLLLVLKDVWYSIPEVDAARSTDSQNAILQRIVTMSIRAYYSV